MGPAQILASHHILGLRFVKKMECPEYRIDHHLHHPMHEVTLEAGMRFQLCLEMRGACNVLSLVRTI